MTLSQGICNICKGMDFLILHVGELDFVEDEILTHKGNEAFH